MAMKSIKLVDAITGIEEIIERPETKAEEAERVAMEKQVAEQAATLAANAIAKAALLEKLGITEDEAKLLLA